MRTLKELVRDNIWCLEPYSCARNDFKGHDAHVFLDANESPFNNPWNRYPDPLQEELKAKLSTLKGVKPENMFLGNGSDEAIDLVYRIFCSPGVDNVVAMSPSYGMYKVCAAINNVEYREVMLSDNFQLDAKAMLAATDASTKVMWICSPNNPTGNDMDRKQLQMLLEGFDGIIVVDEAYGDFSDLTPMRNFIGRFPRLIVLNTLSKAWASASIRLGMAFADEEIIKIFNKVKYPYNVNTLTQKAAMKLIADLPKFDRWLADIRNERKRMLPCLIELPIVKKVYPTNANFVLIKVSDADSIYRYLVSEGIIVRNRNRVKMCEGCLRITIGNSKENSELLGALRRYE